MTDKTADIATTSTTEQSLEDLEAPSSEEAHLVEHEIQEDLLNTSASAGNSLRSSVEQDRKLDSKLEANVRKEPLKTPSSSRKNIFFFKSATGRTIVDHFITLVAGLIRFLVKLFENFLFKEEMPIEPAVQIETKTDDVFRLDPHKKKKRKSTTRYIEKEDFKTDPSDDPTLAE